jgi:hypothetical protein
MTGASGIVRWLTRFRKTKWSLPTSGEGGFIATIGTITYAEKMSRIEKEERKARDPILQREVFDRFNFVVQSEWRHLFKSV